MTNYLETHLDKFTFKVAQDRHYTTYGVWAFIQEGVVRVGLTDFLQQTSGDIAFAEVQPVGTVLTVGDVCAEIETIKVDLEILSPLAGKILQLNPSLEMTPEVINEDPYTQGWLCEIEPSDWESDLAHLLDPEAYFEIMKNQAEEELKKK
jgi:glycine cleavage system H protein